MKTNRKHYSDSQLGNVRHDSGIAFMRTKLSDEEKEAKRVEDAEYSRDNCLVLAGIFLVVFVVTVIILITG